MRADVRKWNVSLVGSELHVGGAEHLADAGGSVAIAVAFAGCENNNK